MKYKNKISILVMILLILILLGFIAYLDNRIAYRIFLIFLIFFSLVFYVFAIFEYYIVEENSILHVSKLGFKKDEARWKEVKAIFIFPDKYFKAIRIQYGELSEKEIVINTGVKDYKKLIKIILDKTKDNDNITIDKRLNDFIK